MTPDTYRSITSTIHRRAGGTIFGVVFRRRSDGAMRRMCCRLKIKPKTNGGQRAYDPKDHDLLTVWEMGKGYRSIPVDGIESITIRGRKYP